MKLNRKQLRRMILKEMAMIQKINGDYRAGVFMSSDYRTAAEEAVHDPFNVMMDPNDPAYEELRRLRFNLQQLSHFVNNRPEIYNNQYFMGSVRPMVEQSLEILDNYPKFVIRNSDVVSLKIYLNHILTLLINPRPQVY